MKPQFVTITGVDDRTDLGRLAALSARFPVEWAVLYSPEAQGVHQRFPSQPTIDRLFALQAQAGMRLAAHLCGRHAKAVMKGEFNRSTVELSPYGRIQVNHLKPKSDMLRDFAVPGQTVIAQWRGAEAFPIEETGHQWLYDPSGGRGVSPTSWPLNPTDQIRGYAGGLGLHNVAAVAHAVSQISPSGFWLDLETGARTDDWLDLDLVEQILAATFA
jgi:hypothetical protein